MKIVNVTVVTERAQDDKVLINTDLPKGVVPFGGVEKGFVVYVSQGSGVRYAMENFYCDVKEVSHINGTTKVVRRVEDETILTTIEQYREKLKKDIKYHQDRLDYLNNGIPLYPDGSAVTMADLARMLESSREALKSLKEIKIRKIK